MSNLRYITNPLSTGAWQVSSWDAGQSSILRWSPNNVTWNTGTQTLDFTLAAAPAGSARPLASGEIQSTHSASTGTWGWTAQVPDLVSGSVFGLFTYKADHFADPWIEFDFEFLGVDAGKYLDTTTGQIVHDLDGDVDGDGDVDIFQLRLNIHMETDDLGHVSLEEANDAPLIVTLPFDVTEGQHTYDVTVTGSDATFRVDGQVVGTFSALDMPGGIWTTGAMKSFVNLWAVDPSLETWAGEWQDPGKPIVGKVSAITYAAPGGTPVLVGQPTIERLGTASIDRLLDLAGTSTDFQGGAGNDRFVFSGGRRGGASERDVIWDFNPYGDALLENDTIEISKALAGVKNFSGLYRNVSDVEGDAVLRMADGSTVTFEGLRKAQLGFDDFALV